MSELGDKLAGLLKEAIGLAHIASESAAKGLDLRVRAADLESQDAIKNADEAKLLRADGSVLTLRSWGEFLRYMEFIQGIKYHLSALGDVGRSIREDLQHIGYSTFPGTPPNVYDEHGRIIGMAKFERLANIVRQTVLEELPAPEPLGSKKQDLSRYMDAANLTKPQRECFSLRFEHGLSLTEVARRLKKHRSTVQQHIRAAEIKMETQRAKQRAANRSAVNKPTD